MRFKRHRVVATHAPAFTLVELLVVVAIIGVLMSILIPALKSARENAQAVKCMANMRQIGNAGIDFAADHDGRSPGSGHRSTPSGASISWEVILNTEVFGVGQFDPGPVQLRGVPSGKRLNCPKYDPPVIPNDGNSPSKTWRSFKWNGNASGGTYSLKVDPPPNGEKLPIYDTYTLGSPFDKFAKPSFTFLLIESERTSDSYSSSSATPFIPVLGGDTYSQYSTSDGIYSFRHPSLTANYLFIDIHVETMPYTTPIVGRDRYSYGY